MTAEEVVDLFAPHQSSVDTVVDWLVESGISRDRIGHSANKQVCAELLCESCSYTFF